MFSKYNFDFNEKTFEFKKLSKNDFISIKKIQDENTDSKTYFKLNDNEIIDGIESNLFLGVFSENILMGFCLLLLPQDNEKSLYSDLNKNYLDVLTFDAVVVSKECRGFKMQKHFIEISKDICKTNNIKYIGATVSPLNIYSKNNFIDCGFKIIDRKIKYGNNERLILQYEI